LKPQDQLVAGGRVRRKLPANGGSIKVADIPNAGVAKRGENDGRHGFLYRRQRFRSAAEEKQSGHGDPCPTADTVMSTVATVTSAEKSAAKRSASLPV
jgi:hypothetical protein